MIFSRNFFSLVLILQTSLLFSQVSPYQNDIVKYDYKPFKYNTQLATQVTAQKQLNFYIEEATRYSDYCLDASDCNMHSCVLKESDWLEVAVSFSYKNKGYSLVGLKNGKSYYFHYIPPKFLKMWENSNSPGRFYHNVIKPRYSLTQHIRYAP